MSGISDLELWRAVPNGDSEATNSDLERGADPGFRSGCDRLTRRHAFAPFYPQPPVAHAPVAIDVGIKQCQDFDYFASYFTFNRSFTQQSRSQAEQLLAQYRLQSVRLSEAQFDLDIAQIVALADNGHSRVQPGPLSRGHSRLPCRLYRFDDASESFVRGPHVLTCWEQSC
jgi:hypothetical protein